MLTDKRLNYVNECINFLKTTPQTLIEQRKLTEAYFTVLHVKDFPPEQLLKLASYTWPSLVKGEELKADIAHVKYLQKLLASGTQYLLPLNGNTVPSIPTSDLALNVLSKLSTDLTLPFPVTTLVFDESPSGKDVYPCIINLSYDTEGFIEVNTLYRVDGKWVPLLCRIHVTPDHTLYYEGSTKMFKRDFPCPNLFRQYCTRRYEDLHKSFDATMEDEINATRPYVYRALSFLYALQSKTYEDTIVQPRLSRAAAERRAKRKQPPVIETRVLTLKVPQVVHRSHGAAQGGTHASPREHTRSGHWRHLANGKEVWIRDCIVGSAEKGKIKKIYNVVTG